MKIFKELQFIVKSEVMPFRDSMEALEELLGGAGIAYGGISFQIDCGSQEFSAESAGNRRLSGRFPSL